MGFSAFAPAIRSVFSVLKFHSNFLEYFFKIQISLQNFWSVFLILIFGSMGFRSVSLESDFILHFWKHFSQLSFFTPLLCRSVFYYSEYCSIFGGVKYHISKNAPDFTECYWKSMKALQFCGAFWRLQESTPISWSVFGNSGNRSVPWKQTSRSPRRYTAPPPTFLDPHPNTSCIFIPIIIVYKV